MDMRSAVSKINRHGILLVFPINNRKQPHSLWSDYFPKTKLRWEWDDSGDSKVFDMWALMKRLSDCKKVVYSKWYQNRATFFSRELFQSMLCIVRHVEGYEAGLSSQARQMLDILEQDSPLSTKDLKRLTELQGRMNEPFYNKGIRELFQRLLIVAFGEVEDGAFPSLAMGSTRLLYEELWLQAGDMNVESAMATIDKYMPAGSSFRKHFDKVISSLPALAEDYSSL